MKTVVENGLANIRINDRVYAVTDTSYRRLINTLRDLGYTRHNCGLGVIVWDKKN